MEHKEHVVEVEKKFCNCGKEMYRVPCRSAFFYANERRRYACSCGVSYVVSYGDAGNDSPPKPKAGN